MKYVKLKKVLTLIILIPLSLLAWGEEIQLDPAQLKAFLQEQIAAKIEEAFMTSANSAEGAVRNATYFNEILGDYEQFGVLEKNFAQTAVELYRGYREALKKDAEETDPDKKENARDFIKDTVKTVVSHALSSVLDQESQQIVSNLKGLWDDAQERMDKILEAKKYLEENPTADAVKVLRDMGLSGSLIDDMEFLEVNYKGLKNMASNYIEAYGALVTVTGALRSSNPGDKIEALFELGAQFGGRIPVLGMFVQKYFEVAQAMIKACKGLGSMLRKREEFCVGGETTGQQDTIGGDPRNIQWVKQFPDRQACPENQVGIYRDIYTETGNAQNVFFWVDGRFVEGLAHGGLEDLRAMIQWLRNKGYNQQAGDVKFLAGAYNIKPGFLQREKEVREKALEIQREIHQLVSQLLCKSEVTEDFLLNRMGVKKILDGIDMDHGLVRSFPCIEEIIDKVHEDRLIKGPSGFYNDLLQVLNRVQKTMVFSIVGKVTDGQGRSMPQISINASPGKPVITDCSSTQTDEQGNFRVVGVKEKTDAFDMQIKAKGSQGEDEEKVLNISGTQDEYLCDISMGDTDQIVSLVIAPQEKTLKKGETVSFNIIGVKASGETERIPSSLISWKGAASGTFVAKEAGTFTISAEYRKLVVTARVIVKEGKPEDVDENEELEEAINDLGEDSDKNPCEGDVAGMIQLFESLKLTVEQKYMQFTAAAAKFYSEINSRRADPCTNRMVAFTYYTAKGLAQELIGISTKLQDLYSEIVVTSALCDLATTKETIKSLIYGFGDIGSKLGVAKRSLAAMQGKLGELACDEQEVEQNGQQVTAQGNIDPNFLQQGGGMVEVQGDSVDNTGEGLQDERNYNTALLIMVWDSGSAKDDIFSVSLSGHGPLGSTPKGGRQVFAPERVQPSMGYTVTITTLVTDVGAGTWSVMVSYRGRVLVPPTAGSNNGSVSFIIPAD